jgi:hypothetical protein
VKQSSIRTGFGPARNGGISLASQLLLLGFLVVVLTPQIFSQDPIYPRDPFAGKDQSPTKHTVETPYLDAGVHDNGLFYTVINNNGIVGNLFNTEYGTQARQAPSFYHPRYTRVQYGYWAALWVGGIKAGDTLVSVAMDVDYNYWDYGYPIEMWPDIYPFGKMEQRSNLPNSPYYHPEAKAEVEFSSTFTDTFQFVWFVPRNSYDQRDHRPLGIEVKQTSYSWSFKYAADFILVDYEINNLTADTIKEVWVGEYYVGCARYRGEMPYPPSDDIAGYIYGAPHELDACGDDLLRIAYCRDNDGHASSWPWQMVNTTSAFGIAPLRMPDEFAINNFNWWNNSWGSYFNFGPRQLSAKYPLRMFSQRGLGSPFSDHDKYYMMSKPEIDYDGHEVAVDHSIDGWLPPPDFAGILAEGHLPQFVTSYGPQTLNPYGTIHLTLAFVIGEDVHWNPQAYDALFRPTQPERFSEQLDYSDLIENVRWARRIYDNPGVDTDNDGDSGVKVTFIDPETLDTVEAYCSGDGVPDFRGAAPPPPPEVRLTPEDGRIIVRWNGRNTENFFDPFSALKDFEGYRVYLARSDRVEEVVMLASFDNDNYNRLKWDNVRRRYVMNELPFTLDSLKLIYGSDFDPMGYSPAEPLAYRGYLYYFQTVDYNRSDLCDLRGIHKVYPDAEFDLEDLDENGNMRYYEYEYFIEDLLPSVPYWVSVSAFDFGHPPKELEPLESSPAANMVKAYAQRQGDGVLRDDQLNVYCYPNPYRVDGGYIPDGYENRDRELWYERARVVRFANLPHRCTISIYSLDGDLVDEIEHDEPEGSGTASVDEWDLLSRNSQSIVTGLYYWVVESEYGQQIGKLAIIK